MWPLPCSPSLTILQVPVLQKKVERIVRAFAIVALAFRKLTETWRAECLRYFMTLKFPVLPFCTAYSRLKNFEQDLHQGPLMHHFTPLYYTMAAKHVKRYNSRAGKKWSYKVGSSTVLVAIVKEFQEDEVNDDFKLLILCCNCSHSFWYTKIINFMQEIGSFLLQFISAHPHIFSFRNGLT